MFSAHKGHRRRRRGRIAVALTALAAGAASVFLMIPAHAGTTDTSGLPSAAQLRERVQSAKAHLPAGFKRAASTTAATGGTGTVKPHIIGGTDTPFSAAPWMVQLWYDNGDGTGSFCGGTLVAPNKVLTAGHCVAGLNWAANGAVVGGTTTFGGTPDSPVVAVRSQWSHAYFNDTTVDNDVALLTLATPLTFGTLPLASGTDTALYAANTQATVYGWGVTDSAPDSQSFPDTLQHLQLPINSDQACTDNLDAAIEPGAFIKAHMMCAGVGGTGDDSTGKTTCSGDSGGPLVVSGRIVGIVSWGVGIDGQSCNVLGTYDVFTRVSAYGGAVQPRIYNTDVTRDGKADLIARTSAGATYTYASTGTAFKSRANAPVSLKNYNAVVQADMNRDGYQDFIVRNTSTGNVYYDHRSATNAAYSLYQIGTNWKTRRAMAVPGDLTGDGIPDVLSETSDGRVWIYPGKSNGAVNGAVLVASGWTKYNLVVGHGDFTNDGKADVFVRDARTGNLYLLQGTGNLSSPFAAPLLVRSAYTGFNTMITPGDITGDGRADLLARTTSGTLYLYKGTGTANSAVFAAPIKIGSGWNSYNLLG